MTRVRMVRNPLARGFRVGAALALAFVCPLLWEASCDCRAVRPACRASGGNLSSSQVYFVGIGWYLMHFVVSIGNDSIMKFLGENLPPFQIVFLRFSAAALVLLPILVFQGRSAFKSARLSMHAARGVLLALGIGLWCYGLSLMPFASCSFLYSLSLSGAAMAYSRGVSRGYLWPGLFCLLGTWASFWSFCGIQAGKLAGSSHTASAPLRSSSVALRVVKAKSPKSTSKKYRGQVNPRLRSFMQSKEYRELLSVLNSLNEQGLLDDFLTRAEKPRKSAWRCDITNDVMKDVLPDLSKGYDEKLKSKDQQELMEMSDDERRDEIMNRLGSSPLVAQYGALSKDDFDQKHY
eukprot:g30370.t1